MLISKFSIKTGQRFLSSSSCSLKRPKSFAFSGCGWLIPFHLGVLSALRENNVLSQDTIFSGTSGGAITAFLAVSDISEKNVLDLIIDFSRSEVFHADIDNGLRFLLKKFTNEKSVSNCNNRLHTVVTNVWPPSIFPKVISTYKSEDDIIEAIMASSYIPLWSSPRFTTKCLDTNCLDGGILKFMPDGEITVSPFCRRIMHMKKADISPLLLPSTENYSTLQLIYWGLNPAPDDRLRQLFLDGKLAGNIWFKQFKK